MRSNRSRLALLGVLALALSVTVGLVSGTAEAKKGKKKKGGNSVTLTKSTPTPVAAGDATNQVAGVGIASFTVGKKGKGKVVAPNSLTATFQLSDPSGGLDDLDVKVVAPDGTTVFLDNPAFIFGDSDVTTVGPLTQTVRSSVGYCELNPSPPPAGCPNGDPDNVLPAPWAGTARDLDLAFFNGVPARGTWMVKAVNFSTATTHVLASASLHMNPVAAPK
jgi:hypothetical protein